MMPAKVIVAANLVKTFKDFRAVDDISFEVEGGKIFGFLGPNGAGKTTTIKMLTTTLSRRPREPSSSMAMIRRRRPWLPAAHLASCFKTRAWTAR